MILHYRSTKISKHGFNFPCQFNCQEMSCIKISTIMATTNVLLHSGDWQQQNLPEDTTFIHATSHNYVICSDTFPYWRSLSIIHSSFHSWKLAVRMSVSIFRICTLFPKLRFHVNLITFLPYGTDWSYCTVLMHSSNIFTHS